jgi:hypothetical protein
VTRESWKVILNMPNTPVIDGSKVWLLAKVPRIPPFRTSAIKAFTFPDGGVGGDGPFARLFRRSETLYCQSGSPWRRPEFAEGLAAELAGDPGHPPGT